MVDGVDDRRKRISAVFDRKKVESRLELSASSASLLERGEVGPEGGSLAIASARVAAITHVFPTPRGP